jgi:hypothetical protein
VYKRGPHKRFLMDVRIKAGSSQRVGNAMCEIIICTCFTFQSFSVIAVASRVLHAGQNFEGMTLTPQCFARGQVPEMSAHDPQISRGFPDMTSKTFGAACFALCRLCRVTNPSQSIFCLSRLLCTVYTYRFSKLAYFEGSGK